MRASSAPSPSSSVSVTIAPWRWSSAASQPRSIAAQIASVMVRYAASATGPLGGALAASGCRDLGARRLGEGDERTHGAGGTLVRLVRRPPEQRAVIAEARERRRHRREGVGLVLHHGDDDAHGLLRDVLSELVLRGQQHAPGTAESQRFCDRRNADRAPRPARSAQPGGGSP
jgi:hypothetical protein